MTALPNDICTYADFFTVDEGYYPEINESSIKDPKNKWQATFPHADIVKLLKSTERMLSRLEKKSLWIEGAYGTGKSRVMWLLRNLLTCTEEEFVDYFDAYENLRGEVDLRTRLQTIRKGKIVTATRYATGDITSTKKLIYAVFDSLTAALRKSGCKFDGTKTLRGKIAHWLEADAANLELFRAKILKPEYQFSTQLVSRSAEEIIERLKNPNAHVDDLVEQILQLGDNEGIRAFDINMTELIDWITEVIAENNLRAIVFFWDEFSKFFANNRHNLDEFQRLAELSNIAPFYFVIATHESDNLSNAGDKSFRTVADRFIPRNITMPDNIAFELIGHALKVNPLAKKNWRRYVATLMERTDTPRKAVMKLIKATDDKIIADLLPLHPMTALLLKNLATYFASNQRSVFNFIKNSEPNVKAFQYFIATKSPEDGDLLTVDGLWNFFYESGTDSSGGLIGKMNLPESIRTILDTYSLNKRDLTEEEQTVLKAILLFQSMDQASHGNVELFHPTEKNIELAFAGVETFENGRAVNIANDLADKEIVYKKKDQAGTFAAKATSINLAEIERIRKTLLEKKKTIDLVADADLLSTITLTPALKERYLLHAVTVDNFTSTLSQIISGKPDYHINCAICFARNAEERFTIKELLGGALNDTKNNRLAFIDASTNFINDNVFDAWLDATAREKYHRATNPDLANECKSESESHLKNWRDALEIGSFVFYPALNHAAKRKGVTYWNIDKLRFPMLDNVQQLFEFSFDNVRIPDTLFASGYLKRLAEAGIRREEYSMFKTGSAATIFGNIWIENVKYWRTYPSLRLSRLKIELDAMIKSAIAANSRISFDDIIGYLVTRGFMPVNVYAVIIGFLLKEYGAEPYRVSSGNDTNIGATMNIQKLAECIGESMKPGKNHRPKYLEILSPNQKKFIEFVAVILNLPEESSVERSANQLRTKLKSLRYPFWCYVAIAKENYKDFLRLLTEIANLKQTISIAAMAEQAGQFLTDNPKSFLELKDLLTAESGRAFFTDFVRAFDNGALIDTAKIIGVRDVVGECLRRADVGENFWRHDMELEKENLQSLAAEFKIVALSRKFGVVKNSFSDCLKGWRELCRLKLKVPHDLLADYFPSLQNFFKLLYEIVQRGELSGDHRELFLRFLTDNAVEIAEVMTNVFARVRREYSQLPNLTAAEMEELFTSLPRSSFTDLRSTYRKNLTDKANDILQKQSRRELLKLWRELTGTDSPGEWSRLHRTPIMIMIPKKENTKAVADIFNCINSKATDSKILKTAIDYLNRRPDYFAALNDSAQIESAFRETFIGEKYSVLLEDNDELRAELSAHLTSDAHQWYPNIRATAVIEDFAKKKYYDGGAYDKVSARVMRMSDSEAKQLLISLLDKNYEVGLKLLREGVHYD